MKYAIILAMLLLCGGCAPTTSQVETGSPASDPMVFKDKLTGCEYLTTQERVTLTPRIAADGKTHMGCKGVEK